MTIKELKSIIDYLVTRVDENTLVMGLAKAGTLDDDREVEVKNITIINHKEREFYTDDNRIKEYTSNSSCILINVKY